MSYMLVEPVDSYTTILKLSSVAGIVVGDSYRITDSNSSYTEIVTIQTVENSSNKVVVSRGSGTTAHVGGSLLQLIITPELATKLDQRYVASNSSSFELFRNELSSFGHKLAELEKELQAEKEKNARIPEFERYLRAHEKKDTS